MSSESLLENVHGGVHFWKSYRHCCLQLFRNKFHCNCVSEFPHLVKQSKWNKLPLPLGRSQENVHDGVHFWNSYRYCCSQLLKKSSTLVGSKDFSKSFETKYIKKLCLPSVHFKKNACQRSSFSRSYWVLPPTFWKNNSTVVISKVFPKSFETKQIKKLSLPSELFQKMFTMKFISGKITDFYFQP